MSDERRSDVEQGNAAAGETTGQPARSPPKNAPQAGRTVSDPREVATLVMARMHMVNTKKDELTIAIKSLSDMTQQLATAYAQQLSAIDRLAQRVQALESGAGTARVAAGTNGVTPPSARSATP